MGARKPRNTVAATPSATPVQSSQEESHPICELLEGETVSFADDDGTVEVSDEELNSRYAKGEVRIVTEQARYPLTGILNMLRDEVQDESGARVPRYKLDPQYQRRHRWSIERKSRLIESFLMNVPVPPVFLYEQELARFEVMDGRQRLTALSEFYADEFALDGLQYWPELNGRRYSQLPVKVREGINRRYISSIILLKETATDDAQAAKLKKMVFERLNSGGVRLANQEARNAVSDGPLNQLCLKLSENLDFRRMWGIPPNPDTELNDDDEESYDPSDSTKKGGRLFASMEDVELVLRFFAYRQIDSFKAGLNKTGEFFDRFLARGNTFPMAILSRYREMFESTVSLLFQTLGLDAFCVMGSSSQPTKIVYDPIMYAANSQDVLAHREQLISHKQVLRDELARMYHLNPARFAGRKTNYADAQQRNRLVHQAFRAAIEKLD